MAHTVPSPTDLVGRAIRPSGGELGVPSGGGFRAMTAQGERRGCWPQIEGALRVAQSTGAPKEAVEELHAIHRRLHQAGSCRAASSSH